MLSGVRLAVERATPRLAAAARRLRDEWTASRARPYLTRHGFTLVGDAGLDASREATHETAVFAQELSRAAAVIDVGANVGLFTLLAAEAGLPVVAVEPHPLNVRQLLRNVRANGARDVEVYPLALSDAPGVLALRGGGQGASLERGWGGIAATYETLVPVTSLDRLLGCRFVGEPLLVKLDVEGHEHAVLRGAAGTLARSPRPVWLVEHGLTENFGGRLNPHFAAVFDTFWAAGYTARAFEDSAAPVITRDDVAAAVRTGVRPWVGLNVRFA